MPWIRAVLKGQKVLARVDDAGRLQAVKGRVEVRYKPNDGRKYQARLQGLEIVDAALLPDETCGPAEPVKRAVPPRSRPKDDKSAKAAAHAAPSAPKGAVLVYTDGACSGNPGPSGLGVVVIDGDRRVEISQYLGVGTNNIAELTAVERGLQEVGDTTRPVVLHTDSRYVIGVVQEGHTARANVALVERLRLALARRPSVQLVYVPGHAGVRLNELADSLAREAIRTRASRRTASTGGDESAADRGSGPGAAR